jgi:hypothetical protein
MEEMNAAWSRGFGLDAWMLASFDFLLELEC